MKSRAHHIIFVLGLLASVSARTVPAGTKALAATPPRGWNSYDSFTWVVNETEFLDNCQYMADHLLEFGYEYCVIDFLWYQLQDADDDLYDTWKVDEYGRQWHARLWATGKLYTYRISTGQQYDPLDRRLRHHVRCFHGGAGLDMDAMRHMASQLRGDFDCAAFANRRSGEPRFLPHL